MNYEREKKNTQTFLSFIFRIMCPERERERGVDSCLKKFTSPGDVHQFSKKIFLYRIAAAEILLYTMPT